jgi:hypothetical protein
MEGLARRSLGGIWRFRYAPGLNETVTPKAFGLGPLLLRPVASRGSAKATQIDSH